MGAGASHGKDETGNVHQQTWPQKAPPFKANSEGKSWEELRRV